MKHVLPKFCSPTHADVDAANSVPNLLVLSLLLLLSAREPPRPAVVVVVVVVGEEERRLLTPTPLVPEKFPYILLVVEK